MKHQSTRTVYDYWTRKRGDRAAPARADINPMEIPNALGDTFMLAADFVETPRFRLAGTRVCALFSREIKGEEFAALWSETSRPLVAELMAIVNEDISGVVAGVTARTEDGAQTELELLLLPLAHVGHARIRALGVLVATAPPYWIGVKPVLELVLGTVRHLGAEGNRQLFERLIPAAAGSRVRHGFVVYSGGREMPAGNKIG